jgi:cytochrome P450
MTSVRSAIVWGTRYGISGVALRAAARRGDLIARSAVDPAALDNPAALYPQLRAMGRLGGNKLISATARHDVVNEVLRSEAFFANPGGAPTKFLDRIMTAAIDPRALGPVDIPSLLAIQPPQHARIRRLVTHAFTPRAIAGYTERIRSIANELADRAEARGGQFDLIEDYASKLPLRVIAEIMGIPERMHADLLQIGNDAAMTLDPALTWRDFRTADRAIRKAAVMFDEHIATLRRTPGDDLLSELVQISADGDRLSDEELRVNALLLLGAGFETTVNLLGNAVVALDAHRDQWDALARSPGGWGTAVEEVLRFDSPVQITGRTSRGATLGGREVAAGQRVTVLLGAANRDPDVFPDAGRFDVTRANARDHLAFSGGIHYCLGAGLARLEGEVGLRALTERFPRLRVAGRPVRRDLQTLRGYEHLPVTLR